MADRELSNKLSSGEVTQIKIGGTASTDIVPTKGESDASYTAKATTTALTARVSELEASHSLLIVAKSLATVQQPTVTDTPLQVEFGALQTTTDIDLSAAGAFTFKTAGKYIVSPFFQYGRTGGVGASILLNRYLINGVQIGDSLSAKIDNADTLVPWSSSIQLTVNANDVLTIELMRDSANNNSGGLFSFTPTVGAWAAAPCASIQIFKAT